MTLTDLMSDLKAAGANVNTIRLAMNCYELGQKEGEKAAAKTQAFYVKLGAEFAERVEREACAKEADAQRCHMVATAIRARGQQ